jgi:Ni,Fe-hydrogenase I large subunit
MQEVKMLEDRIIQGGIIAFHDVFSQFVKQTEAYEYLLSTGKYEEIKINWQEIFDYLKENNISEDDNNSWHKYPELPYPPNFIGALKRK